jgi:hypothetical protein
MILSALRMVEGRRGTDLSGRSRNAVETSSDIWVVQDGIHSHYRATLRYFSSRWNTA